jgi:hypothetical protein
VYQGSVQDTVLFRPTVMAVRETGLVWAFGCVSRSQHKHRGVLCDVDNSPPIPWLVLTKAEISLQITDEKRCTAGCSY